jgi:hypothetical protein
MIDGAAGFSVELLCNLRWRFVLIAPCPQFPTARTCPPLMDIAIAERALSLT